MFPWTIVYLDIHQTYRERHYVATQFALRTILDLTFLLLAVIAAMTVFTDLGISVFGGDIRKEGDNYMKLQYSLYGESAYWPLNFNDFPSGFITMFTLLHVNNMHITTDGFVAVTTEWAQIFFGLWYAFGVLLLMNILIAFFLVQIQDYLNFMTSLEVRNNVIADTVDEKLQDTINAMQNESRKDRISGSEFHFSPSIFASNTERKTLSNWVSGMQKKLSKRGPAKSDRFVDNSNSEDHHQLERQHKKFNDKKFVITADESKSVEDKDGFVAALNDLKDGQEIPILFKLEVDEKFESGDIVENSSLISRILKKTKNTWNSFYGYFRHTSIKEPLNIEPGVTTEKGRTDNNPKIWSTEYWREKRELWSEKLTVIEFATVLINRAYYKEPFVFLENRWALECYRIHTKKLRYFQLASVLISFFIFFERPLWTYFNHNWENTHYYPASGVPILSFTLCAVIKLPLLTVILIGLLLELQYEKFTNIEEDFLFSHPLKIRFYFLLLLCCVSILLLLLGLATSGSMRDNIATISSALGIFNLLYLFWFDLRASRNLRVIYNLAPRFILFFMILPIVVLAFASFGPYIANVTSSDTEGQDDDYYFNDLGQSTWSVFVSITSSSFPNQIIPLYTSTRITSVYFVSYIIIGSYIILQTILVFILFRFRKTFQKIEDRAASERNLLLLKAYEVLDNSNFHTGSSGLSYDLMRNVFLKLLTTTTASQNVSGLDLEKTVNILVEILDVDNDGKISISDFLLIADVLNIRVVVEDKRCVIEKLFPEMTGRDWVQSMKAHVHGKDSLNNKIIIDVMVVGIIIAVLVEENKGQYYTANVLTGFIAFLCSMEVGLKFLFTKADLLTNIIKPDDLHIFSLYLISITGSMLITLLANAIYCSKHRGKSFWGDESHFWGVARFIAVLRMFVFIRSTALLDDHKQKLKAISVVLKRAIFKLYSLAMIFFLFFYVFIFIGSWAFGGKIDLDPDSANYDALTSSNYGLNDFYNLNFNDHTSAIITLFSCTQTSDFDVVTSGFSATTSKLARIYFSAWYIISVLLILNIIKSFFLADFMELVTLQKQSEADSRSSFVGSSSESSMGGTGPRSTVFSPSNTNMSFSKSSKIKDGFKQKIAKEFSNIQIQENADQIGFSTDTSNRYMKSYDENAGGKGEVHQIPLSSNKMFDIITNDYSVRYCMNLVYKFN